MNEEKSKNETRLVDLFDIVSYNFGYYSSKVIFNDKHMGEIGCNLNTGERTHGKHIKRILGLVENRKDKLETPLTDYFYYTHDLNYAYENSIYVYFDGTKIGKFPEDTPYRVVDSFERVVKEILKEI